MSTSPSQPATWLCPPTASTSSSPPTHPGSSCISCQVRRALCSATSPRRSPKLSCPALAVLHFAPVLRLQLAVAAAPCCCPWLEIKSSIVPAQPAAGHNHGSADTICCCSQSLLHSACWQPTSLAPATPVVLRRLHPGSELLWTPNRGQISPTLRSVAQEWALHHSCCCWPGLRLSCGYNQGMATEELHSHMPGFVLGTQQAGGGCWLSSAWLTPLCVCTI